METFLIVKRKDEAAFGTFRTKDTILSIYDEMADAIRTGKPGQPHPPNWPIHIHPPKEYLK